MNSLRPYLRMLLWAAAAGVVAYIIGFFLPKTYSSSMALYFPGSQSKGQGGGLAALTGIQTAEPDAGTISNLRGSYVSPLVGSGSQTATGILTSKSCLLEVIAKLGLTKTWGLSQWAAYNRLASSVSVRTEKTGFLKIEATVGDPELCRDIVQKMLEHLDRRSVELTLNVSSRNRKQVEEQYNKAVENVENTRQALIAASAANSSVLADDFGKFVLDAQARYDEAKVMLDSGRARLATNKSLIKQILNPNAKYPMNLVALNIVAGNAKEANAALSESLGILSKQMQERRLALADASKKYRSDSPELKQLQRSADAADSLAAQMIGSQAKTGARADLVTAEAEVKALEQLATGYAALVKRYKSMSATAPAKLTEVEALRSEFQNALVQRGTLETELSFARLAEVRDPARYEVVDEPLVEPSPIAPRKGMIAAMVAVLVLVLQIVPRVIRLPELGSSKQGEARLPSTVSQD